MKPVPVSPSPLSGSCARRAPGPPDGGYAHTYSSRGQTEVSDGKRTPGEAGGVPPTPTPWTGHA